MIPRNRTGNQKRSIINNPLELLETLNLSTEQMSFSEKAVQDFRFKVPAAFAAKIQPGNAADPLLRQIFPVAQETHLTPGYSNDPLAEAAACTQPGLLQKYHGRALLLVTSSCAINCRYCFRRHYPYEDTGNNEEQIRQNIDIIAQDDSITEVILSGGDPLSLSDKRLARLISQLNTIPHLKRLRLHSRFPIVEPQRINSEFLKVLASSQVQVIIVLHINHAQEIGSDNKEKIAQLQQQDIILLNQSVLLKGVNDTIDCLEDLSNTLIDNKIIPYYLHILDKIQGSAHFEVSEQSALRLYKQLRARLPGYMLPRLVTEIAGETSKKPLLS